MAINIPIVTDFNSKGLQDAQNSFTNFRSKIAEADGTMGKMKAGFGAAMESIKANASSMALMAGGAIAGFALKAIGEFQDLALEVDGFANSTGLATEEASRYIEVAGDLGIESASVETAINKMNTQISKGTKAFEDLGIEVIRTDDGLVDVNETFINAIGTISNIKDPTDRARVATELFGKGWRDMSEIITGGEGRLRQALAAVSDAKIINTEEIQRAKELRDAQDALKDALEGVTIAIGKELVPAFTDLLNAATPVMDLLEPFTAAMFDGADASASYAEQISKSNIQLRLAEGAVDLFNKILGRNKDETDDVSAAQKILESNFGKTTIAAGKMRYAGLQLADQITDLDDDTNGLIDTFDRLLDQFERDEAVDQLKEKFKEYETTVIQALGQSTPENAKKSEQAMRDLVREMADVAKNAKLTSQEQVKIVALLEKGQYDAAYQELLKQLAAVPRQIPIEFIGSVSGIPVPAGQTPSETIGGNRSPSAPIQPGFGGIKGGAPIGGIARPFNLMPTSSAGTNVTVNVAGSVTSENDLVESIRKGLVNAQRNGSGLVYSNF